LIIYQFSERRFFQTGKDALSIIRDMNAYPERRSESFEQYRNLQELIK